MNAAVVVGAAAAICSIASFVPQAYKIWKTKQTKGLATPMWILSTTAFALWTSYGVINREWPIIVPNVICGVLAAFILTLKIRARKRAS